MENICLDTNTIISYLFLSEPQHTIIKEYINKYPNYNYFYTEHILEESEEVFYQKQLLLRNIITDFTDYLEDYHNEILSKNQVISYFTKKGYSYKFKDKIVSNITVKNILEKYWQVSFEDNMEGFQVYKKFDYFLNNLNTILYEHRENFLSNLILIPKYTHYYKNIEDLLISNNSHTKDNLIILDLMNTI